MATRHPEAAGCGAAGALGGRTVIVTGAGSGIGRATAIEAAARGARAVLVGRRRGPLDETAGRCRELAGDALAVPRDLAGARAAQDVVEAAVRRYGRVDALVNNAGLARFGPLRTCRDEDIEAMFAVNFLAVVRLIRAAAAELRAARGCVVNVSSIGGVVATPDRAAYGAIKAAVNHLTRSLARELAPEIRVNAILPGPVDTPMYDDLGLDDAQRDRLVAGLIDTTPALRMGRPPEIAHWICHFLEEESAWSTGALLTVDGGRSC